MPLTTCPPGLQIGTVNLPYTHLKFLDFLDLIFDFLTFDFWVQDSVVADVVPVAVPETLFPFAFSVLFLSFLNHFILSSFPKIWAALQIRLWNGRSRESPSVSPFSGMCTRGRDRGTTQKTGHDLSQKGRLFGQGMSRTD